MIRRPRWWPEGLWPGTRGAAEPAAGLPGRRRRTGDEAPPAESFLRAVVAAFGAEGASVYRLDRAAGAWVPELRAGEAPGDGETGELRAAGHPLTWCLREDLLLQVSSDELLGRRVAGWSLAGPVPGGDRALLLTFRGSPPAGAREGLRAAVEHLAALHAAGLVGGERQGAPGGEPIDGSGGRP